MTINLTLLASIVASALAAQAPNNCSCQPGDTAFHPEIHLVAQDVGVVEAQLRPDWAMTPALVHHRGMGCMFTGPYRVQHVSGIGAVVFRVDPHTPVGFRFLLEVSLQVCDPYLDVDGTFGNLQMRYVCDTGPATPRGPDCRPLTQLSRELTGAGGPRTFKRLATQQPTPWP